MSQSVEKLAKHVGVASSLAPPKEEKRQRRSGSGGPSSWLKRGGWAAADAAPEPPPKEDSGEPKKKRPSGRRKTAQEKAAEKAAAKEAREAAAALRASAAEAEAEAAEAETAEADAEAARRGPRELFPEGSESGDRLAAGSTSAAERDSYAVGDAAMADAEDDLMGAGEGGEGEVDGGEGGAMDDLPSGVGGGGGATPSGPDAAAKRKRARGKRVDEGDRLELKARHLKGKRKEDQLASQRAHLELAAKRAKHTSGGVSAVAAPSAEDETGAAAAEEQPSRQAQLDRLLRPKARRWVMYEWFYSLGDHGYLRDNAFGRVLQQAGMGHVTHLTRSEWSYVRLLVGKPRRLSAAFLASERAKLESHREHVRHLRRTAISGGNGSVVVGDDGTAQMAVGQRVTAFHPKERHLFTGTVLTPDGDHYRVQFDRPKLGVQLVHDHLVVPMLDGSRGIDFTSPHGTAGDGNGAGGAMGEWGGDGDGHDVNGARPSAGGGHGASAVKADTRELQLLAYVLRLLERKQLLMTELKAVCIEAERELKRVGQQVMALAAAEGGAPLIVPAEQLNPPPVRVEVSAAQQRVLGQVPTPPIVPSVGPLLVQLRSSHANEAQLLERRVAMWRQETEWLQEELRSTARALDTALAALRPTAQRFSLVLGAAAPEPLSRGLGMPYCAELRDCAHEHANVAMSATVAERGANGGANGGALPSAVRETLTSAVALLLQMHSWASSPMSAVECRVGLLAALKKLTPACEANRANYADVMATAQMLQSILCGVGVPGIPTSRNFADRSRHR
jgi:hypothetical protein